MHSNTTARCSTLRSIATRTCTNVVSCAQRCLIARGATQIELDTLAEVQAAVRKPNSNITWTKALSVHKPGHGAHDAKSDEMTSFLDLPLRDQDGVAAPQLTTATLLHGASCELRNGTVRVAQDSILQLEGSLRFVNTTFVGAAHTSTWYHHMYSSINQYSSTRAGAGCRTFMTAGGFKHAWFHNR